MIQYTKTQYDMIENGWKHNNMHFKSNIKIALSNGWHSKIIYKPLVLPSFPRCSSLSLFSERLAAVLRSFLILDWSNIASLPYGQRSLASSKLGFVQISPSPCASWVVFAFLFKMKALVGCHFKGKNENHSTCAGRSENLHTSKFRGSQRLLTIR